MQTRLVDLVLNLLRKDQYAAADENPDELYLVTDDAGITGADVTGALGYVPYNGTTNPNHYATVSSLPTVGNGTIRIKQDNKIQQFTVNQTATQLISLNGLYDYYTINATVHSSPTISGSRVSDFSNGWLSTQYQFPNNWEISTTFFLDNPPSETANEEEQMIIYSPNLAVRLDGIDDDEDAMSVYINGTWYNLGIYPYSGEDYQVTISSYNQADGVHTVGTYVYVFSTSADEEFYNAKLTSNVVAPTNTPVEIQFGAYNGTGPLQATMYFDETYINVLNGASTRYWTGAEKTIDTKANKDLSNLTPTGEKHFLNKKQITNCILETPSNWMTYSGSQVTIKAGTKYLVPNGRNADGTLNNAEVTLQSDVVFTNTGQYDGTICILADVAQTLSSWGQVQTMGYYRNSSEFPVPATGFYWLAFSEEDNYWYITADGAAYTQSNVCPLGTAKITSNSSILSINPFKPVHLLTIGNREEISGWGMPSYTYIDLTLGASGATYQAPANGWYTICSNSNGTYPKNIELINSSGGDVNTSTKAYNNNNSGWLRCSLPVKKGDIVACYYNNISLQHFRFVYAQGSGSEG